MIYSKVAIGDRLLHNGAEMIFRQRRGSHLDWLNPRDHNLLSVTDDELQDAIERGVARILRAERGIDHSEADAHREADFAALTDKKQMEALRRQAYVDGAYRDGLIYRPAEADLQASIEKTGNRRREKRADWPSVRSLRRWMKRGGEDCTAGQFVTRDRSKGNRTDRLGPELRIIMRKRIESDYLTRAAISVPEVMSRIRHDVREANKDRDPQDQLRFPGEWAVRDMIRDYGPATLLEMRYGTARASQVYGAVQRQKDPTAPLDVVEIDHTIADLFVVDDFNHLPIGRPTIAFGIDRCTRMPWGLYIGFEPPSVLTVMQLMKNGIHRKKYVAQMVETAQWDIENDWPVSGIPHSLLLDRAMENLGDDIAAFCADLPIKRITFAPRKRPQFKGAVERYLGTVNRTLLQKQSGGALPIADREDYDPRKNAIITLDELQHLIHKWVIDVYSRSIHKGIRNIPVELWNDAAKKYPPDQLTDSRDVDALFGRTVLRMPRRIGIQLENIEYWSEEFDAVRLNPEWLKRLPLNKNGKPAARIKYDPAIIDVIRVHVVTDKENRWITVPAARAWQDYVRGLSMWEHKAVIASIDRRNRKNADLEALDRARSALAHKMLAAMKKSGKIGPRKKFARLYGAGRIAFYGESIATAVPQSLAGRSDHEGIIVEQIVGQEDGSTKNRKPARKDPDPIIDPIKQKSRPRTLSFDDDDDDDDDIPLPGKMIDADKTGNDGLKPVIIDDDEDEDE